MRRNPSERFWEKVEPRPNGCWEWTAARLYDRRGQPTYGSFKYGSKQESTHRVAWQLLYGPIPNDKMVMHRCDNPPCVRPSHLELGDHRTNMDQMVDRRRFVHGLRHHSARLTIEEVRTIKRRLATGERPGVIAHDYPHVTSAAVFLISTGKNWGWLGAA